MSDVLEIGTGFWYDVDDTDNERVNNLKHGAKSRKGRGIGAGDSNSAIKHITEFDTLSPFDQNEPHFIPQKSVEGWVLFVTGIHEEATEDDIKEAFSDYGTIVIMSMNLDRRTGFQKGYAFVKYANYEEALKTKENLNGTEILGQKVTVNWCFVKGGKMESMQYN